MTPKIEAAAEAEFNNGGERTGSRALLSSIAEAKSLTTPQPILTLITSINGRPICCCCLALALALY